MKKARKHEEPSAASLREIPEIDFTTAKVRKNPYAARIAKEGFTVRVGKGRPKKGKETGPSITRSVRFPAPVWKKIEVQAKAAGLSPHAALRMAVMDWVKTR